MKNKNTMLNVFIAVVWMALDKQCPWPRQGRTPESY